MAKRLNAYLKLINQEPIVDEIKLQAALEDYQKGNSDAIKIITEECLNIIPVIAKKYEGQNFETDVLLETARLAFIESIARYNFKKQGIKSEYFVFFMYDYIDSHLKFLTRKPEIITEQKILTI